jgi:hypothetical protein
MNVASSSISIDLGSVRTFDVIAVLATNAGAADTMSITCGTVSYTVTTLRPMSPLRLASDPGPRYHGLWQSIGAPINAQYIQINLSAAAVGLQVAGLVIGKAFVPAVPQDWGDGIQVFDRGARAELEAGGISRRRGDRGRSFKWTWGRLSDAEALALLTLALDRGETAPVLCLSRWAEPGLWARLIFGDLQEPQSWTREAVDETIWELAVREAL